jgi:hypothetical protein
VPDRRDPRERIIESFATCCDQDDRVLAAFVGGSFASGSVDAFSDLDLYAIIRANVYDQFLAEHRRFVGSLGQPVFLEHFDGLGFDMLVFILENGVHGELGLARPDHFFHIHGGPHRALVDKEGLLEGVEFPWQRPIGEQQVEVLRGELHWFWRDLSLYGVAMARRRPWTAAGYLASMRRRCIQLIRLRHDFGSWAAGYEKLESVVPEEDLVPLEGSFPVFDRRALVDSARSLISWYRRVGPELARGHGLAYPCDLEEAVLRELSAALAHARGVADVSSRRPHSGPKAAGKGRTE